MDTSWHHSTDFREVQHLNPAGNEGTGHKLSMGFFSRLLKTVLLLGLTFSQALYEGKSRNSVQLSLTLRLRGLTRLMVKVLPCQL